MAVSRFKVHSKEIYRFSRGRESDARVSEHHNTQGDQEDGNDGFCIHIESIGRFLWLQHWLSAGDDPQQNCYNGKEEENVDQAACGAGHQPQHP